MVTLSANWTGLSDEAPMNLNAETIVLNNDTTYILNPFGSNPGQFNREFERSK